jgi:hypothetical protein
VSSTWRAFKRGVVPTLAALGTGAVTGAGVGAALGEVVPGPGTVIGGIGGAVVGGLAGGVAQEAAAPDEQAGRSGGSTPRCYVGSRRSRR